MRLDAVKQELGNDWAGFENAMESALRHDNPLLARINRYLMDNSGKQLRPVLSLLAAQACGKVSQMSYECAAVCEIIHTATLLHDDVADNADLRRGVPTVKAVFSPSASVLTGDYWLAKGMNLLIEKCNTEILGLFTKALHDLSVGEIVQMEKADSLDTSMEDYYKIIECKTASLFIAAVKSGAISAGACREFIDAIGEYAFHLGLAFQMRDDIFDYSPDMETGKPAGLDLKERKITLPLLCVFEENVQKAMEVRKLIGKIDSSIAGQESITDDEKEIIGEITSFINAHDGLDKAQHVLECHIEKAIEAVAVLPESLAKERLVQLAQYVGKRKS